MKHKLTYALCMALLFVCGQILAASGTCGDNLKWILDNNGTLTISGTGIMYDYGLNDTNAPWYQKRETITTLKIDEGVTSIGTFAFTGCSNLTSAIIGDNVATIGKAAFYDCIGLTSVTIPNSVATIGEDAFEGCNGIISVTIGNSVTSIKGWAFKNCSSLESIIIPNSVTSIEGWAFHNCISLASVELPNSVTWIGTGAFKGCTKLTEPVYNAHVFAYMPPSYSGTYKIPDGIENIAGNAFADCTGLTSVTIPNSVTSIGWNAFYKCTGLAFIHIPKGVKEIGACAFQGCSSLTTVYLDNETLKVDVKAFDKCEALKEVHYKEGVYFSNNAFSNFPEMIAYSKENPPVNISPKTPSQPPLLALVDGSLKFSDTNSNNRIDADEKCTVKFKVANNGKGAASNCEARVKVSGTTNGITVKTVKLPTIAAGSNYEVSVPVTSSINTIDGLVSFAIEVYEPQGWGVAPFTMNVATKAYNPPFLQVVDYNIASNSGKIRKMEPFTISFNLQNTKYGDAEEVKVKVNLPNNVFVMDGSADLSYSLIKSGEVKSVKITLAANNNYSTMDIPITIDIKEKHGKFAENKQLNIALNQTTSSSVDIAAKEEAEQERQEIQLAMIKSDVDRNIPTAKTKNANTFVLIIANEHYSHVASVPFALNDGNIFREYCVKTLGIGEKHIKYLSDATGNDIKTGVNWLANLTEAFDNPQIIVYYAGHGIPDEASKSAYLLPVDGSGTDVSTGYKLDELYATLGNMPASRITVFMDACFSGSKREEGMLASARGVALKGVPQGKMVVFSAAQGDETAYPNREQQHGMFTYYLLKKLQETQGDIALKDLGDYVTKQVSQQSLLINSKKQTPCVTPSASIGNEWQTWKLK